MWVSFNDTVNTLRSSSLSADRKSEEQGLPESRLPEFSAEVLRSKKSSFFWDGGWVSKNSKARPNNGLADYLFIYSPLPVHRPDSRIFYRGFRRFLPFVDFPAHVSFIL